MTDDERNQEALFRHAILGDVLSRNPRRGQLRPALKQLAEQTYEDHHGRSRRVAYKTLEEWFYKYRNGGFDALKPRPRSDRNRSRVLTEDLQQLFKSAISVSSNLFDDSASNAQSSAYLKVMYWPPPRCR